jgi:geranylgeranyl pyrophosphate synthase
VQSLRDEGGTEVIEYQECSTALEAEAIHDVVVREIARRWPDHEAGMNTAHRHALVPPGKLLRPLLMLRSALAVGGALYQVLPAAVGFEAVHVGSLIHDDIIDEDTERRGRPAVHVSFGPSRAIIAGNALYFEWFTSLGECVRRAIPTDRVARAMQVQAEAGVELCRGAFDEVEMAGDLDRTVEEYLCVARAKTAVLFEAACKVGAILAGADAPAVDALGQFGHHLGIAFQIRDDLLPFGPTATGKPHTSDVRNQRPTLPLLLAYRRADPTVRDAIRSTLLDEADPSSALARMRVLLDAMGSLDEAHSLADRHTRQAGDALGRLPSNTHTAALRELAGLPSPGAVPPPRPAD